MRLFVQLKKVAWLADWWPLKMLRSDFSWAASFTWVTLHHILVVITKTVTRDKFLRSILHIAQGSILSEDVRGYILNSFLCTTNQ